MGLGIGMAMVLFLPKPIAITNDGFVSTPISLLVWQLFLREFKDSSQLFWYINQITI